MSAPGADAQFYFLFSRVNFRGGEMIDETETLPVRLSAAIIPWVIREVAPLEEASDARDGEPVPSPTPVGVKHVRTRRRVSDLGGGK